jgi:adenylate cyclase
VEGVLLRAQKRFDLSEECLRQAWLHFQQVEEHSEAARTEFEVARTLMARRSGLAVETLQSALDSAEKCQRAGLVSEIQFELKKVNELEYYKRIYQRARGRSYVSSGTESLFSGKNETLTVLFLDVKGSTEYAKYRDPEAVMMTMNVMNAHFVDVLRHHDLSVTSYRGDGFMALSRGLDHPRRAVHAALHMIEALAEFNWPPSLISQYDDHYGAPEMKPLSVRIGIATGEAFIGNVGTYDKMDYTALGTTCNLGARLEAEAKPLIPCISQATYERVRNEFLFASNRPRFLRPKGLEDLKIKAWDVIAANSARIMIGGTQARKPTKQRSNPRRP